MNVSSKVNYLELHKVYPKLQQPYTIQGSHNYYSRFEKATALSQNTSSAIIIELSAIIHLIGASDADTFHDFAVIIYYYIMGLSKSFTRIDILLVTNILVIA